MATNAPDYIDRRPDVEKLFRNTATEFSQPLREQTRQMAARLFGLQPSDMGPLKVGDQLGPYKVVDLLGLGGQAFVYEARHAQLGRLVALKVPRAEVADRLLKEARLAASLEHTHVVRVEDVREDETPQGTVPYLVMERCSRGSLEDLLERHPEGLPLPEVRRIAGPILDALAYAHEQGIVHRDIKPANVLFDEKNQPKLSDFGIGAVAAGGLAHSVERSRLTAEGVVVGTPLFWAPEQENPSLLKGGTIDGRADLFSFGKVLYLMLTGSNPSTIKPPSRVRPGLDPAWDELIFQLLEEDREQRPRNARALSSRLETLLGKPIKVVVNGSGSRPEPEPQPIDRDLHIKAREAQRAEQTPPVRVVPEPPALPAEPVFRTTWASRVFGALGLASALFAGLVIATSIGHSVVGKQALVGVVGMIGAAFLWWFRDLEQRARTSVGFVGALVLGLPLCIWQPPLYAAAASGALSVNQWGPLVMIFGLGSVCFGLVTGASLWARRRVEPLPTLRDPRRRNAWEAPTPRPPERVEVRVGAGEFVLRLLGTVTKFVTMSCLMMLAALFIIAAMVVGIVAIASL